MSKTIDERVVSMQFDNKHFEANVQTSMNTLEKFKHSLNMDGASRGLENVNAAAKNVNVSGLSGAVETVRAKFSALEVVAVTALANITNSAVNAGKRILSALTVEPVKTGFNEYELKMNSVQTIMASTGEELDVVNQKLEELNEYADRTIYSFSDMTTNIGKFTNADVSLDDAVAAIQGISNEAAVSGANANEASRAMYNFAQALSAGYVKLIDWKSIENANMATVEFKEQLIATAVEMGTVSKSADGMYQTLDGNAFNATKNFNEVLQDQWMTSEVLITTLKKYSDETTDIGKKAFASAQDVKTLTQLFDVMKESVQSGWAQTWEIIVGDFEEAKSFFTTLSKGFDKIITSISDARNAMLKSALGSKWEEFDEKIKEAGVSTEVFKDRLKEITAKQTGKSLDELIERYGSLEKVFSSGELSTSLVIDTLKSLAGTESAVSKSTEDLSEKFEYFKKVVADVWMGDYDNGEARIKALTDAGYDYAEVQELVNKCENGRALTMEDLSDAQLTAIGYTEEEITKLRELADQAEKTGTPLNELIEDLSKPSGREMLYAIFTNALNGLTKSMESVKKAWSEIFPSDSESTLRNIIEAVYDFSESLKIDEDVAENLTRTFKGLFALLDIIKSLVGGPLKLVFNILCELLGWADLDILEITANIGDMLVGFRDWIKSVTDLSGAFEVIVPFIKKVISGIGDWIDTLKTSDNIPRDIILGLVNGLKEGIPLVVSTVWNFAKTIIEKVCEVLGIHSPSTEFWDIAYYCIVGFVNGLKDAASLAWDTLKNIGLKCIEIIKNLDFGQVFALAASGSMIFFLKKIGDAINILADPLEALGDVFRGAEKVLMSFSKVLKSFALGIKAEALKDVAIAVAILVGSIVLLTLIGIDKFWPALLAVVGLVGALGVLAWAIGKFGGSAVDYLKFMGMVMGISVAILILAAAVKILETVNPENAIGVFVGIIVLSGILVGLLAATSIKDIKQVGKTLLMLSAAIAILAIVVKMLGGMTWADIFKSVMGIAALGGIIVGLIAATKLAGKDINSIGITLLAISGSIAILALVAKTIAGMSWAEMGKAAVGIVALGGVIVGLIAATKLVGRNDIGKIGAAIFGIAGGMLALSIAARILAGMSWSDMFKASLGVAALGGIIVGLIAATKLAGQNDLKGVGPTLLMISFSIGILAAVAVLLSMIDVTGLTKGVMAVGALGGIMAGLVFVTKYAKNCWKNLVVLTVAVAVMAAAIAALSMIDGFSLASATASLMGVMSIFSLMIYVSGKASKSIKTILFMTLTVAVLGALLFALASLPVESTIGAAAALSLVLISLTTAMAFLSDAKNISKNGLAALVVMFVVVAGLGGILSMLQGLPVESTIVTAVSLSVMLIAMSAVCVILSKIPDPMLAIKGALGLVAVLGIIALVLTALGGLSALTDGGLEQSIEKGGEVLALIGNAIGRFIGSLTEGITASLPAIAQNLSDFMTILSEGFVEGAKSIDPLVLGGIATIVGVFTLLTGAGVLYAITSLIPCMGDFVGIAKDLSSFIDKLGPFLEGAKTIKASSMEGVSALANVILALTAAQLLDGIASFITGGSDISAFAEELVPFGTAMVRFSDIVSGNIDGDAVTAAANAGKIMASMVESIPASGGVFQMFTGEHNMEKFSNELVPFGTAIVRFSNVVAGKIDAEAVTAAANAGKIMAGMVESIPASGGVFQMFTGEHNMEKFSNELVPFGTAMVRFSGIVTGKIDAEAVTAASNAGKIMASMIETIPNSGGVFQMFTGEHDFEKFSNQLVPYGRAMVRFSSVVSGNIDGDAVTAAADAGKIMAGMIETIPNSGGVIQMFTGEHNFEKFGEQIVPFGTAMVAFSRKVAGNIDTDAVQAAANAGSMMASLQSEIPESGGIFQVFTGGEHDMGKFAEQIVKFGEGIVSFSSTLSGNIDSSVIDKAIDVALMLKTLAYSVPDTLDFTNIKDGLVTLGDAVVAFSDKITGKVDIDTTQGVIDVGKAIAETADIMPDAVNLAALTTGLTEFGDGMVAFSDAVSDKVDKDDIQAVAEAGKSIAYMANAIPADLDMSGFATGLSDYGSAIIDFQNKIEDNLSLITIASAIAVGNELADMTANIPDNTDKIYGFANNLASLGVGIKRFSAATDEGEVDIESVKVAKEAGLAMCALCAEIPDYIDFVDFTTNLPSLAESIAAFSTAVKDNVDSDAISKAATAGTSICAMVANIPDYVDVTDFIDNLPSLAEAIANFSTTTGENGVNVESLNALVGAGTSIGDMITNHIPQYIDITDFISSLPSLSTTMVDFVDTISGMNTVYLEENIESFNAALSKLGNISLEELISGLDSVKSTVSDSFAETMTESLNEISDRTGDFKKAGANIVKALLYSIKDNTSLVVDAFVNLTSKSVVAIREKNGEFKNAGVNVVKGFTYGIANNTHIAVAASRAMAAKAAEAAKAELDEHSPSKVFYGIGDYAGLAFVNALLDYGSASYNAGSEMAGSAKSGLADTIAKIADAVNSDIDIQPTIRPILDLSDIENGASAIGGMFGRQTLSVNTSSVGAISASMARRQNGENTNELVSAIKELRSDLTNTPRNVYNIDGITYDDGSNISNAVKTLVRAARVERRI